MSGSAGVSVQNNNGGWTLAQTANSFTNWTATNLPVSFGSNMVQAYAVDAAGNVSMTKRSKSSACWRQRRCRAMRQQ